MDHNPINPSVVIVDHFILSDLAFSVGSFGGEPFFLSYLIFKSTPY